MVWGRIQDYFLHIDALLSHCRLLRRYHTISLCHYSDTSVTHQVDRFYYCCCYCYYFKFTFICIVHVCLSTCWAQRTTCSPLLSPHKTLRWNSGHQACHQAPLPSEPSLWLSLYFLANTSDFCYVSASALSTLHALSCLTFRPLLLKTSYCTLCPRLLFLLDNWNRFFLACRESQRYHWVTALKHPSEVDSSYSFFALWMGETSSMFHTVHSRTEQ